MWLGHYDKQENLSQTPQKTKKIFKENFSLTCECKRASWILGEVLHFNSVMQLVFFFFWGGGGGGLMW
jgi:hypothetical protein